MRLRQIPAITLVIGLILSGCNLGENRSTLNGPQAVFTAAAQTLQAQLTQIPPVSPTEPGGAPADGVSSSQSITEPPATGGTSSPATAAAGTDSAASSQAAPACDSAKFVGDVTIPDGTILGRSQSFTKTWRFTNTGSCTWNSSYSLVFDTGEAMGASGSQPLPGNVVPGQQVDLSINLQAPADAGSYRGYWRLRNPDGVFLPIANGYKNKSFYVDIQVKNSASNPSFAVTNVVFSVTHSGTCSAGSYTVTAKVTTNGAGEVAFTWKRSDGVNGPLSSGNLSFPVAQTQAVSYQWASGATGLSMTLYIDSPNHQNFGTALLNCP